MRIWAFAEGSFVGEKPNGWNHAKQSENMFKQLQLAEKISGIFFDCFDRFLKFWNRIN